MAEPLSSIERRVYHYLIDFLSENTFQPSIRDIARKFRIRSTKSVSDILHALAHKGYIIREATRSRGVRLLGLASAGLTQPVPCYGRIHAGEPALLPEHREGYFTMDRRFLPAEDVFFLRVKGDSMRGRGILDGDFVLVSPSAQPNDGDIVAARLGPDAIVKTLHRRGSIATLEPAAASEKPIDVGPGEDVVVLGVVCGVFRPFHDQVPARDFSADSD